MKKFTLALASVLGLFVGTRADAGITLGLSNLTGSTITFDQGLGGGLTRVSITRVPTLPGDPLKNSFDIGLVNNDVVSSSLGLQGNILGSGFTYKAAEIDFDGSKQTAILSSIGINTFQLIDADDVELTATITGVNISTDGTQGGTNSFGTINLTGMVYLGTNAELIQLKNEVQSGGGIATLSFTWSPARSLTQLATGSEPQRQGYTIAVSTVPEPGSMVLAFSGVAMLGLGYYRQQRRRLV